MALDGSGLQLLTNPGTRHLTHVRKHPSEPWLTATRYNDDPDGNGLAMEIEAGTALTYSATEIVVFPLADPSAVTAIAGGVAGKICANSSWTDDGRLILLQQDDPVDPNFTRIKRVAFSAVPSVLSVEVVTIPAGLYVPVDPHQSGPSDATGTIVFSALFQHATGWMRPVWRIPASGSAALASDSLVGCPVCGTGCCAWPDLTAVLGTNDPRMDHAGNDVMFMQQNPNVSFGSPPNLQYPFRALKKPASGPQVDLTPAGTAATTSITFGEWRQDDQEVVYWTIQVDGLVLRQHMFRMNPDGTGRVQVPLPRELCPTHPSYLNASTLMFSAWRCGGPSCTCDVAAL